jgi:L-lactate dehydrogenase (cytochrome)
MHDHVPRQLARRWRSVPTFPRSSKNSMIIANIDDYRKQCEARLPRFLYDYISGGSFQENTLRANIAELQATLLRRRVMVDESQLNLSINLWDQAMSLPVVLGPVAMAGMYSSRGEGKAANAAKAVGVPFTLSTMGVSDVHEVAQKTGVPRGSSSTCSKIAVSSRA